jgi:hypothetical protein
MKIEVIGPRTGKYTGDLLAAAPDLLTALQSTLRCLAWHEEQHGVGMDAKAIADARAAIAKATGETL